VVVGLQLFQMVVLMKSRDGNGAGRARVSLSYTHPRKNNSSSSSYPNPTGIKLLIHPHPYRVTHSLTNSILILINFYKIKKIMIKET